MANRFVIFLREDRFGVSMWRVIEVDNIIWFLFKLLSSPFIHYLSSVVVTENLFDFDFDFDICVIVEQNKVYSNRMHSASCDWHTESFEQHKIPKKSNWRINIMSWDIDYLSREEQKRQKTKNTKIWTINK